MKPYQLFGVFVIVVQIWYGTATELPSSTENETSNPVEDHGFIELMIQKLNMDNFPPVDISQMEQSLQHCEQRMETITELIVTEYPKASAENLLSLLSATREVFSAIGSTANTLENSLHGIVGCVDLAVLDIQIALQVLVEAFLSNCEVYQETETPVYHPDEATASAVYCLSSAVKSLLISMSEMVEKISISTEKVDQNIVPGLEMVARTVLNIVDRVLYCLKRLNVLDLDYVEPSLEKFSLIIQRLVIQRLSFVSKISPMIISPISDIQDSLKSTVDQELPTMTRKSIDKMVTAIAGIEETLREKNISESITSMLDTLQPIFVQFSSAVHSIQGITDAVAYSTDLSLQNLMGTVKCLTYYVAIVTKMLGNKIDPVESAKNIQSMLCFVASTIQTLIDGLTMAAERALVDLICLSPTMDKALLERKLLELQTVMEPIFLALENIIRTSMGLVQRILTLAACTTGDAPDLIRDMNMMINNLQRIIKEIMESALTTKDMAMLENVEIGKSNAHAAVSNGDSVLSICVISFETAAKNSIRLKLYVNDSIDQIRRLLVQM